MSTIETSTQEIDTTIVNEPEQEFSPTKEVGISKPSSFNGDRRRVKEFIQECNVYLEHQREYLQNRQIESGIRLVTDERKGGAPMEGAFYQ